MIDLTGKYASCKIFTDDVQAEMLSQIYGILGQESSKDSKIRIMPDCHAGAGSVIGTTMTIKDKVIPNVVGVDIGCGVLTAKIDIKKSDIDFQKMDNTIRQFIPSGKEIHKRPIKEYEPIKELVCRITDMKYIQSSIGSLGGGNHFIEVDVDSKDHVYVVIHTGSRHLGVEVANYYQRAGYSHLLELSNGDSYQNTLDRMITEYKAAGRQKELEKAIKKFKVEYHRPIETPKALAHVEGENFSNYIHDMRITQKFAALNRKTILSIIVSHMGWSVENSFDTIHNYIDIDETPDSSEMILRKGAVAAYEDQKLIIPMNMRDGSLICIGKGNPDWNYSAPHGAGRILSRTQAKKNLSMVEFIESMRGIYTTTVSEDTLDESAMAYKPMQQIIDNIGDTVEIEKIIKPIYNFKAAD